MEMELLKSFGTEKMPSIIKDPFGKINITDISVYYRKHPCNDSFYAAGNVEFTNGNTSGKQHFEGQTFDEVVLMIKAMIENL